LGCDGLKISTMVQIGKLDTNIDLKYLYKNIELSEKIKYIQYGDSYKGKIDKPPTNAFFNQVTIHMLSEKLVNMKIFNNGRIQMTGIKKLNMGNDTIQLFINEIKKLDDMKRKEIFDNTVKSSSELETALINCDFDLGFPINREKLNEKIIEEGYFSSFEPCTYPGVNIKYYYNEMIDNKGICNCDKPCNGKGKNNTCKRITVAVFKSGKAIITGGNNENNVKTAYRFINNFVGKHRDLVELKI